MRLQQMHTPGTCDRCKIIPKDGYYFEFSVRDVLYSICRKCENQLRDWLRCTCPKCSPSAVKNHHGKELASK